MKVLCVLAVCLIEIAADPSVRLIDSNVYMWRKDTGTLMEVLAGHEERSVNALSRNPKEVGMFPSSLDDLTTRIRKFTARLFCCRAIANLLRKGKAPLPDNEMDHGYRE